MSDLDRHLSARAKSRGRGDMWGNQIRSYVLAPYTMVKDLRTGVETTAAQEVLDGGLDDFLRAALAQRRPPKDSGTERAAVAD